MRQVHLGGERLFIDYSGKRLSNLDRASGGRVEVELYVAVLGASNYTFAEVTRTQRLPDFIGSTVRALEYFGGAPRMLVPDHLRSAVKKPDWYDPEINETFAELAAHYGSMVIPARPRKPRDKAKVEAGVLVVQRWIVARLRNVVFFSFEDLAAAVAELLEELNARPFRKLPGCRRSAFEELDRPALQPLPAGRFVLWERKMARVNIDYHVDFDRRLYSAPHALVGKHAQVRATAAAVEIWYRGRRVAAHMRSYARPGTPVTLDEHRPKSHREYGAWPPSRIIDWAGTLGPSVAQVVEQIMGARPHPEQGYRSCLALLRDAKRFEAGRMDAACRRALAVGAVSRRSVLAILDHGLDRIPLPETQEPAPPMVHENLRTPDDFDRHELDDQEKQA